MTWYVYTRIECILAAVRAYHVAPEHAPLILTANLRRANRLQYSPEELDDLICDGVAYELWGLVLKCDIPWNDHTTDYYYDARGGYRAIYLNPFLRPGTLEWDGAEAELKLEIERERKRRQVREIGVY